MDTPTVVWILLGHIDYEGTDVLVVCETEAIARMFEQEWRARSTGRRYDDYLIEEHDLITGANLVLGLQEISV